MLMGSRTPATFAVAGCVLIILILTVFMSSSEQGQDKLRQLKQNIPLFSSEHSNEPQQPVSFDLSKPPTVGCEDVVSKLQLRLIEAYSQMLKGVRYVNLWGYLETENKGDAAIWVAQQMILTTLGITSDMACRYLDRDCDVNAYNASLVAHAPHSAIVMAGGGNFNDYYWDDQPSRMKMIETFPDVPIRAFPQSVYMHNDERIAETQKSFGSHKDLIVAARDFPSWRWLYENLEEKVGVPSVLVPDIAFAWGNRPDFRLTTPKQYDVLILARDDQEVSAGENDIPSGSGFLTLPNGRNVSYMKLDWEHIHTPGIDKELPWVLPEEKVQEMPALHADPAVAALEDAELEEENDILFNKHSFGSSAQQSSGEELMYTEFPGTQEKGRNARAWAKATQGFQVLGAAEFVITDRLHGHIMSTIIGTPHVLLDSKLGKNLALHNTWTQDCDCVKIAQNMTQALDVAGLYFGAAN